MSTICKVFIRYLSLFLKAPRTENGNLTFGSYLLRRRFFFRVTDMVFTLFALLHLCVKTKIFTLFQIFSSYHVTDCSDHAPHSGDGVFADVDVGQHGGLDCR